jgi:uncharacterized membrane protein
MIAGILQVALGIAYPLLIFFALTWLEPRQVGLVVLGLIALRLVTARLGAAVALARAIWLPAAAVGVVALVTAVWNDPMGLLLAPVLVNGVLLATFGGSLWRGPPMVERFARLQVDDLSPEEVRYTRSVTKLWCGFFVLNGGTILVLALARAIELWTLFTGLVSYVLIGLLFAAEYVYRHWRFRRYRGGFADPILKRLFPPRPGTAPPPTAVGASASAPPDPPAR